MKQTISILFFLLILTCGVFSCKKDIAVAPDMGYSYFPNQVGRYIVYDVDSFYYDAFNIDPITHFAKIDTFKFQLKEKIQSLYPDNQGRPTIRLERYVRIYNDTVPYSSLPWLLRNVWAENRTATTAEKVEDNIRYIKLAFPVKDGQTWNGNAQNTFDPWNYNYAFFDRPRTYGGLHFDSVLQVTQFDDNFSNIIAHQYYIELYAKNVGLIYKQIVDVGSQYPTSWNNPGFLYGSDSIAHFLGLPIMQRVTSGTQYKMTINTYGTEP